MKYSRLYDSSKIYTHGRYNSILVPKNTIYIDLLHPQSDHGIKEPTTNEHWNNEFYFLNFLLL